MPGYLDTLLSHARQAPPGVRPRQAQPFEATRPVDFEEVTREDVGRGPAAIGLPAAPLSRPRPVAAPPQHRVRETGQPATPSAATPSEAPFETPMGRATASPAHRREAATEQTSTRPASPRPAGVASDAARTAPRALPPETTPVPVRPAAAVAEAMASAPPVRSGEAGRTRETAALSEQQAGEAAPPAAPPRPGNAVAVTSAGEAPEGAARRAPVDGLPAIPREAPDRRPAAPETPAAWSVERGAAPATPTIEIHIGRIDVRAVAPARPPREAPPAPALSLADYLKRGQP